MKTPLNLLSRIDVASPCTASWNDMAGDDNVRFCGLCSKNVYNLSALTAEAATNLILEREGEICGRFFRRADGTVLTADCPVGVQRPTPAKNRWHALAASLAGILSLTGSGNANNPDKLPKDLPRVEIVKPLLPPKLIRSEMTLGRIVIRPDRDLKLPVVPPEVLPMPRVVNPESESLPG
jgi:hypothetical protein